MVYRWNPLALALAPEGPRPVGHVVHTSCTSRTRLLHIYYTGLGYKAVPRFRDFPTHVPRHLRKVNRSRRKGVLWRIGEAYSPSSLRLSHRRRRRSAASDFDLEGHQITHEMRQLMDGLTRARRWRRGGTIEVRAGLGAGKSSTLSFIANRGCAESH